MHDKGFEEGNIGDGVGEAELREEARTRSRER